MWLPKTPSHLKTQGLSFAKIPPGLNPFAVSAIRKPGNKNPDLRYQNVTTLHWPKILPHAVFADHRRVLWTFAW